MNLFESLRSPKTMLWWSAIIGFVIIYPSLNLFMWRWLSPPGSYHHSVITVANVAFFIFRYLFFLGLVWLLVHYNVGSSSRSLKRRFWISLLISVAAYFIYVLIGKSVGHTVMMEGLTQTLILQFAIAWLLPVLIGHIYNLTVIQREKEREIEKLRTESLQSRVEALSNQINPHFFFNSLNGLAALAAAKRNEETTEYIAKLSNIFRYILQSDKKGLVTLEEELHFLEAYRYLIEIRYSGKICFDIHVDEEGISAQLPVLSLLPLVENIIKHNIIDSDHKMKVCICSMCGKDLVVSNPVHRKYNVEGSNGIGLSNLSARYRLLTGSDIRFTEENGMFTVVLPLKKNSDESPDR